MNSTFLQPPSCYCYLVLKLIVPTSPYTYNLKTAVRLWDLLIWSTKEANGSGGFWPAPGKFLVNTVDPPVHVTVDLWIMEVTKATNTSAPNHPLPSYPAQIAPWFTDGIEKDW